MPVRLRLLFGTMAPNIAFGKKGNPLETYRDQISDDLYELESLAKETKQAVHRMLDTLC